jgi:hypothetical protein
MTADHVTLMAGRERWAVRLRAIAATGSEMNYGAVGIIPL